MDLAEAKRWDVACKNPASDASHWTATPIKDALSWLISEVEWLRGKVADALRRAEKAESSLILSREEGRREGIEEAARMVDAECARVLATQTGKKDDFSKALDQHTRMVAILLPDIAAAIRSEAKGETYQG